MAKKWIKDDLRYLLFSEIYFQNLDPRAGHRAFDILEAAIVCFARKGLDEVTMPMVAREAKVTRQLVAHYFKDMKTLQQTAIKYIRFLFQKLVVDAFDQHQSADKMLGAYIEACFDWVETYKVHAQVWFFFLFKCGHHKQSRELNTTAVEIGEERIQSLLQTGKEQGLFKFSDARITTKFVQTIITGALLTRFAENLASPKSYREMIVRECLTKVGC